MNPFVSRRNYRSHVNIRFIQPQKTAPTAAAATAAAQAFLANRASNANLSSAAAAAALRTHARTPTPVSEVQTKRMLQRQISNSSNGSTPGTAGRPGGLLRQTSSGSMTERTFREPSPARRPQSRAIEDEPPPMPPLPVRLKGHVSPPPLPAKSIRRPASVEPPERMSSPPPKLPGGRGVSLDRGPGVISGKLKKMAGQRNTSLVNVQEIERPGSRNSVNYSRPMSPQSTPPTSPLRASYSSIPTGRSVSTPRTSALRSALTEPEVENIQHLLRDTAGSPVSKKKKNIVPAIVEGSHLSNGTSGIKPTGTALQSTPQRQVLSSSPTPSPTSTSLTNQSVPASGLSGKKKKGSSITPNRGTQGYGSESDTASEQSYSSDRPRSFNSRAAGLLMKQPSIVREDREAEEHEERVNSPSREAASPPTTAKSITLKSNTYTIPKPSTTLEPAPVVSTAPSTLAPENAGQARSDTAKRSSLSPARAAHFSTQPVLEPPEGLKHQPSGRSVSPAKSALKHSPSPRGPSPAGVIPGGWNRPGQAPSEASDTTSIISDDGYRSMPKKKKNVRVSFDDDPTVVGRSATPPPSLESPIMFSPQSKDNAKRGWFDIGRDKKKEQSAGAHENDDVMKPMPILRSFGSVRPRKDSEAEANTGETRSLASGEGSAQNPQNLDDTGTSSDAAVGEILAHVFGQKSNGTILTRPTNDPIPPEVTSVEGTGYNSDTDESTYSNHNTAEGPSQSSTTGKAMAESKDTDHFPGNSVPHISVQPATPGIEESSQPKGEYLGMPGEFPGSDENPEKAGPITNQEEDSKYIDQTPSSMGISEPEPEAVAAYHDPASPIIGEVSHSLRHQTELHGDDASDDTGGSIYSDAPEDMSDLEGDGFGSINAIVESPTLSTFQTSAQPSPIASNGQRHVQNLEGDLAEPRSEEGWDKAQAYWSGLSQSRKSQIEEAASSPIISPVTTEKTPKPLKKKRMPSKDTAASNQPQLPSLRTQNLDQGPHNTAPQMKKSLRDRPTNTAEAPHFRSSMREVGPQKSSLKQNGLRSGTPSTDSQQPKGTLQKKLRPVSAVAMVDYNKAPSVASNTRSTSDGVPLKSLTPVKAQPAKKLAAATPSSRRRTSNGSDSSSSFKKSRPAASDSGRYTMKRSMRASSVDERSGTAGNRSSRFSVRSVSPTESTVRAPFSSPSMGMRSSMRGSPEIAKPRTSKSPSRSFGFGRSSKAKPSAEKSGSRFSSRFGNSSDEEDGPTSYRSRFVDSSDEDEPTRLPAGMAPVRGIPKRIDEGDSTDLEDSADERIPQGRKRAVSPPSMKALEGAALASGSLRANGAGRDLSKSADMGSGLQVKKAAEKDKKKRSFFGSLGRKKDDSKVVKADVESAARRDTPLERSKSERMLAPEIPVQSPKSPKLQRRNTPKRYASDSWPLPENPGTPVVNNRPRTSDGFAAGARPNLGTRQSTTQSTASNVVAFGKNGKKKRFPMLRKAFGLHD
ncbi:hypothetical protein MMC18_008337 [Xylographa bjoerkii]|nr:hypothetical protein [Xylographa bjoerkii]